MGHFHKSLTFVKARFQIERGTPPVLEILVMRDPVCGMLVDEKTAKLKSDHDGHTFYFCSAACKTAFDKDPHKYGHSH